MKRVVIKASRVAIVSRRVVREVVVSRIPEEVSVISSIVGGSVFISSSVEVSTPCLPRELLLPPHPGPRGRGP